MRLATVICTVALLSSLACNRADEDRGRERAQAAGSKATDEAHKLGSEAEAKAKELNKKLDRSLEGRGESSGTTPAETPEEKLHHAEAMARREGRAAGAKLSSAGMLARVKTKLANDVGLATVPGVNVEIAGSIVTLSGTVSTEDQKRQAEQSVSSVDGVSRVVNQITVRP